MQILKTRKIVLLAQLCPSLSPTDFHFTAENRYSCGIKVSFRKTHHTGGKEFFFFYLATRGSGFLLYKTPTPFFTDLSRKKFFIYLFSINPLKFQVLQERVVVNPETAHTQFGFISCFEQWRENSNHSWKGKKPSSHNCKLKASPIIKASAFLLHLSWLRNTCEVLFQDSDTLQRKHLKICIFGFGFLLSRLRNAMCTSAI